MKTWVESFTIRRVDRAWLQKQIGQRIRAERERNGMTAQQVGDRLGVTRAAVSNWELGNQANFLIGQLYDLALVFKVPVRRLLP